MSNNALKEPSDSESRVLSSDSRTSDPDIAIKVENLTKIYKLYDSPQDRLKEAFNPLRKKYHRDFHALHDVSFEVKKGETVGIIGRNGSGKSTLLKIITGVLTPTSGSVTLKGKISAILELMAGFNPLMTGKENIYFNGTLNGDSKNEIEARFDSILEFAEIGEFIHQPVRTYSSGMSARLGFAMAIHVDPDILIIDEALSVGDEAFQRKCFSRIHAFREQGKTILFVSHSAANIIELCQTAHLFDAGEHLLSGHPKSVVSRYQKLIYASPDSRRKLREEIRATPAEELENSQTARVDAVSAPSPKMPRGLTPLYDSNLLPKSTISYEPRGVFISGPDIRTPEGEQVNILVRGEEYVYTYTVSFEETIENVRFGMLIKTVSGLELGGMVSYPQNRPSSDVKKNALLRVRFPFRCVFLPGTYFLNAGVVGTIDGDEVFLHRLIDALMFKVQPEPDLLPTCMVDISAAASPPEVTADA